MAFAIEKRRHVRTGYEMPLKFSLSVLEYKRLHMVNATGAGFDISAKGLGFYTDFSLEPGHILQIEKESDGIRTAMVRWVTKQGNRFRVGVQLYGYAKRGQISA